MCVFMLPIMVVYKDLFLPLDSSSFVISLILSLVLAIYYMQTVSICKPFATIAQASVSLFITQSNSSLATGRYFP